MLESFVAPILFTIQTSQPIFAFQKVPDSSGNKISIHQLISILFDRYVSHDDTSPAYLMEFTKRLLYIYNMALDSTDDFSDLFVITTENIGDLVCEKQSEKLIECVLLLCCKCIDKYKKQIFVKTNGIANNLCFGLIKLVAFCVMITCTSA